MVGLWTQLDAEIEKFRGLGMESDDKRRRVLESLITRLERTETKIDEHEMENEVGANTTVVVTLSPCSLWLVLSL